MSARTWPESAWPTAEEWLDRLLDQPREAQIEAAGRVLATMQAAARCFEQNHAGLLAELSAAREFAAREFERGVNELAAAIQGGAA